MKKKTKNTKTKTRKTKLVSRKFLLDLANRIYNPKTKQALKLCYGTLKNGPDPDDESRSMHCGLGELYFAMTGTEPIDLDEQGVIDTAVGNSTLKKHLHQIRKQTNAELNAITNLEYRRNMKNYLDGDGIDPLGKLDAFADTLDNIQMENDSDGAEEKNCSLITYKNRARRVANVLKRAAKLLPAD